MKYLKTLSSLSIVTAVVSANAGVTMDNNSVGSASSFPATSISGANGALAFQSILATRQEPRYKGELLKVPPLWARDKVRFLTGRGVQIR